jgi:hypothetical protein
VIAAVALVNAGRAFLLDVRHLTVGGDLAIVAGHTPARERREAEEMNETHHVNRSENQQFLYRIDRIRALIALPTDTPSDAGFFFAFHRVWDPHHQPDV